MAIPTDIQRAEVLAERLCGVLGVDYNNAFRVVVDLRPCEPAQVYIGLLGGENVLDINWAEGLKGAEIHEAEKCAS